VVMDNYAVHKRVKIRDWLAANPRELVHLTSTSALMDGPWRTRLRNLDRVA
jgi:hypothetical protein